MAEFLYSNMDREIEVYGYDSVVKSNWSMCHGGCGVLVYMKDGKAVKITGRRIPGFFHSDGGRQC